MPKAKTPPAAPIADEEKPAPRPLGDRGQGRKRLQEGATSVVTTIRLTPDLKDKLELLGGSEWMRAAITKARLP